MPRRVTFITVRPTRRCRNAGALGQSTVRGQPIDAPETRSPMSDARNPRTRGRAIPAGTISRTEAGGFLGLAAVSFIACCAGFWWLDGNVWPILDMMIDSGITCLDPIDPAGGMDLAAVKASCGHRVAVKGNVDCAGVLVSGTRAETIAATIEALRKGMPGGGYICSSSNSIHASVNPVNYCAMMEAIREYGKYPMTL